MILPNDIPHHLIAQDTGPQHAAAVVLIPELGMGPALWHATVLTGRVPLRRIVTRLPGDDGSPALASGDGLGIAVARLASDLRRARVRDALVIGCGVGGLIAQGLAAEHSASTRALILTGCGGKLDMPERWNSRADHAAEPGWLEAEVARLAGRSAAPACSPEAYATLARAVAETDLRASTARLRLPLLALAGSRDKVTPPDLLRELGDTVPGAQFQILRGCGHLPMVDAPDLFADAVAAFMLATGHDLAQEHLR